MGNEASIDLIANPARLNAGLATATGATANFAGAAEKQMGRASKSAKGVASDFTSVGAAAVKNAPAIAMFTFSFSKLAIQIELARAATDLFVEQLDATGHEIGVIDDRLEGTKKLLAESQGDFEKLSQKLDELGVSAEEAGIKFETNFTRIRDSWKKLFDTTLGKGAETAFQPLNDEIDKFSERLKLGHEQDMRGFSDFFKGIADTGESEFKRLQRGAKDFFLEIQGFSKEARDAMHAQGDSAEEKQKSAKILAIQEKMYAQELDMLRNSLKHRQDARNLEKETEQALTFSTVKEAEERIDAYIREGIALQKAGKLTEDALQRRLKVIDAMAQKQATLEQVERKGMEFTAKAADFVEEYTAAVKKQEQAQNVANQELGTLISMLEDEIDHYNNLLSVAAKTEEQQKDILEQQKVIADLEDLVVKKKIDNQEKDNALKLHQINLQKQLADTIKNTNREIEDTQRGVEQDKQIHDLELQGISYKKLHDLKMKFIDEEERKQLQRVKEDGGNPLEEESAKLQARKQRMLEVARFQLQVDDDLRKVELVKWEEKNKREEEALMKRNASEKEWHEFRLRMLREEEEMALKVAHTEAEALKIKFDFERKRKEETQNAPAQQLNRKQQLAKIKETSQQTKQALKDAVKKRKEDAQKTTQDKQIARREKSAAIKEKRVTAVKKQHELLEKRRKDFGEVTQAFGDIKDKIEQKILAKKDNVFLGKIAQFSQEMTRVLEVIKDKLP